MRTASAAAFQLTIAVGAFLLFLVEPMAARFLLPWFGGSPSVWSTCLLFFQAALLGGYVYAHVTRRLGPGGQARLHLILLALAIFTLPIVPSPSWKPTDPTHPAGKILLLLTATVGLPYMLLAATAPMVQDWFARLNAHASDENAARPRHAVYWLYALSNLGSLLGLLAYPSSIERLLSIRGQSWFWSGGFILFCVVCAWAALQVWHLPAPAVTAAELARDDAPIRPGDFALWLGLSLTGTGLLLAVTNELCQNVAVVPLLWIVPLTAYLLTFIVCFSGLYRRSIWMWVLILSLGFLSWQVRQSDTQPFALQVGALLAVLFSGCMVCHGELVHIRPAPRHLTAFYLAVAAGGSIGGIAVALVAPLVLDRLWEFQFFTLLPLALLMVAIVRDTQSRLRRGWWRLGWVVLIAALCGSTYELVRPAESDGSKEVARTRNFYGVLTVLDDDPDQDPVLRRLRNGQILHGAQFRDPAHKRTSRPTTATAAASKSRSISIRSATCTSRCESASSASAPARSRRSGRRATRSTSSRSIRRPSTSRGGTSRFSPTRPRRSRLRSATRGCRSNASCAIRRTSTSTTCWPSTPSRATPSPCTC